jgi:outer membrane autotransporter protein
MDVSASHDLIERQAFASALSAAKGAAGWSGFFSMGGGREKIETGSYVKSNRFSLLGGVASSRKLAASELLAGVFLEGGWGSYSTYNSFSFGDVHGDGDTDYVGIGAMLKGRADSGLYWEASLRGGRVSTDFGSASMGAGAGIDTSSAYYGGHLGLGKETRLAGDGSLDSYLKLFWTRQGGDSLANQAGEHLEFAAANSVRLRLGTRYGKGMGGKASFFFGLAVEREFDGRLKGRIDGIGIAVPDMKGTSGIIELGVAGKPSGKWSFEAAAQGLAGKRRGLGASLSFGLRL